MKYTELERMLLRAGCRDTGEERNGHPLWINPKTGKVFMMSLHDESSSEPRGQKRHFEQHSERCRS